MRYIVGALVVAAAVGTAVLATGVLDATAARVISDLIYPPVAIGAGMVIVAGAARADHRERQAWILIGFGVFGLALGETIWTFHGLVLGSNPGYPGIPDVAYLSGYVAMTAGILRMPHARPTRHERLRLALDALAGTLAAGLVFWRVMFGPVFESVRDASVAEVVVGLGYPIGDMLMLVALIALSTRRGVFLADGRLATLAAGLTVFAVGDTIYLLQEMDGAYAPGTSVDATWLAAYGLFAVAGGLIGYRERAREIRDRPVPAWQAAVPYVAVVGLFSIFTADLAHVGLSRSQTAFTLGVFAVIVVILLRQWAAARENRSVVERERKELISVISHELRTPLTAVAGFLEVVVTDDGDIPEPEKRELLETAWQQSRHLGRIVTDLVAVSRDGMHSDLLHLMTLDVAESLSKAARSVPECTRTPIAIRCEPDLLIVADPDRLNQIIGNLMTNACRYGGGHVMVTAQRVGGEVEVTVEDDGPGVPPRFESAIWERFERGAHRLNAQTPGSGLGLAIVRSLITAHGGRIGYRRSRELGGACFWFTLRSDDRRSPNGKPQWKWTGPLERAPAA